MHVVKDSNLETFLSRQEKTGSRWGEEKESSDLLPWIKSLPTDALTYGSSVGVWLEHMLYRVFAAAPRASVFLLADDRVC